MGELNSPPWWLVHCLASCDPGVTRTRWSASLHAAWLLGHGLFLVTLFAGASLGQGSLPTSSPSPLSFSSLSRQAALCFPVVRLMLPQSPLSGLCSVVRLSREWLPGFGASRSAVFCGSLCHSVWGEGTLLAFCLHMWLPPLSGGFKFVN